MSQANKGTPSPSGAPGPSLDLALKGMKTIEHEAEINFQEHQKTIAAIQAPIVKVFAPLVDQLQNDPRVTEGLEDLRRLFSTPNLRGREMKPPTVPGPQVQPFAAPTGAQVAPQFNWTWNSLSGSGTASIFADVSNQRMTCFTGSGSGSGTAAGRAALGIYFYPGDVSPAPNGILNISALPAFDYFWTDATIFSWAGTLGWIGLIVRSFDLNGSDAGTPVDQQLSLWNDTISFLGGNSDEGSTTGFPLSAQVQVDTDHWYNIWVWCSTQSATGDGSAWVNGQLINVTVPYISLALFS